MRPKRKIFWSFLAAILVSLALAYFAGEIATMRFSRNSATYWQKSLEANSGSGLTYDKTIKFFEENGFSIITANGNPITERIDTTSGTRRVDTQIAARKMSFAGMLIWKPKYIEVTVIFDRTGVFREIDAFGNSSMPPRWNVATTAATQP